MKQRGRQARVVEEDDGRNKTTIGIDRQKRYGYMIVVKNEGPDAYAAQAVEREA